MPFFNVHTNALINNYIMKQSNEMQVNALQRFFEENSNVCIRAQVISGKPWFVAKDISLALGLSWDRHSLENIPEEWKGVVIIHTLSSGNRGGGIQRLLAVNDRGMYKMIFRSRNPEADRIVNWLAGDVMPSLLHTGIYATQGSLTRNGVDGIFYKGQKLYPYLEMLTALGYSKRSGSVTKRKRNYPACIIKVFGRNFITEDLIEQLEFSKQVENKRIELKGKQYQLDFKEA